MRKRITARAIHRPGKMNGLETQYSLHLSSLVAQGIIREYSFEVETLKIGEKRCSYTPDFRVIMPDGTLEFHEVKGFWRDDARVKLKAAAAQHPYVFRAATWNNKAKEWVIETIQEEGDLII